MSVTVIYREVGPTGPFFCPYSYSLLISAAGSRPPPLPEMKSSSLVLLLLIIITLTPSPDALILQLPSGRVKCITDDLRAGAMSVGHYRIAADDPGSKNHTISARVSDPKGESLHRAESVESGEFAFVAAEEGRYTTCFWSPRFELSAAVSVDIDWRTGISAKGWTGVAKKGKIDVMELELMKLADSVSSIHEEMIFLRQREEEARRLNETTNSWMGLFSMLSFVICLGVASLHLWFLKSFFEKKKII